MKIYSMTATFGKLSNQTLTLQPGLNIIEAPNEWGKSTWCAFIVAMLYGIDTRERTKLGFIADKERYAPWSGEPMSGRMDMHWEGRDITIERHTKGRVIFGEFKAYETQSGLPVRELTVANCGLQLLGVEKEVFIRAGFLRLKDLPVTQDDTLRRRLNALVTTGDESGASDDLAQKLKDLKNKVRFNRTGLLPQAEAQAAELESDLNTLNQLQEQTVHIQQQIAALDTNLQDLQNHRSALKYEANRAYLEKLEAAKADCAAAQEAVKQAQERCDAYPSLAEVSRNAARLHHLRQEQDALHLQARLLPPIPQFPSVPEVFRGIDSKDAVENAAMDKGKYDAYTAGKKKASPLVWLLGVAVALMGVALLLLAQPIPGWIFLVSGLVDMVAGLILQLTAASKNRKLEEAMAALTAKYGTMPPQQWCAAAKAYESSQQDYEDALSSYKKAQSDLEHRSKTLQQQIQESCNGLTLAEAESKWTDIQKEYSQLETLRRDAVRARELYETLQSSYEEVSPPTKADTLTFTEEQTQREILAKEVEHKQLLRKLAHCQGQMEQIGDAHHLQSQLEQVRERIAKLETTFDALVLAQDTLQQAARELQRRFAPKITKRAEALFHKLTDGRYDRVRLDHDFAVEVAAQQENALHSTQWRSDGTVDQLYLALRLAVAEELTPEAPLVLDDALVRFDDTRLAAALDILRDTADTKQIILFTCQTRENEILSK